METPAEWLFTPTRSACAQPRVILKGRMSAPRAASFVARLFDLLSAGWICFRAAFKQTGWNFPRFSIAARVPTYSPHGRAAFQDFSRTHMAPAGVSDFPPYAGPSVLSLSLQRLMWSPDRTALLVWTAVQVAFLIATLALLWRRFPSVPAHLVGVFGFSFPAMFGVITGQDTNAGMLLLTLGFALLCGGSGGAAGAVLRLAVYRFNPVLRVPVFLLVRSQHTAIAWFTDAAVALGAASALLTSPAFLLLAFWLAFMAAAPKRDTIAWERVRAIGGGS
jgi:hypothetical protein